MKKKIINNLKHQIPEIIYGDESIFDRDDFKNVSYQDMKVFLDTFIRNQCLSSKESKFLLENQWKLAFKVKPPTIEEFLSPKWIGDINVYQYVRKVLLEFWDKKSTSRHLILSPFIGWGKSFASMLSQVFVASHFWCMRKPYKIFPQSELSDVSLFSILLISFNQKKAKKLYLEPLYKIMENSPMFINARTEESMKKKQHDNPNKICWTKAGTFAVQFCNNLRFEIASDPGGLIGATIVSGAISELSFWTDIGRKTEAETWRMYQDLKTRITSRLFGHWYGRTIIDSSPNSIETQIDNYIFTEAEKNPENMVIKGSMWKYKTWVFKDVNDTFPVFVGTGTKPPKILDKDEVDKYDSDYIIYPPKNFIDGKCLKQLFEDNLIKSIKDYGGVPAGSQDKLIDDPSVIEGIFDPQLKNIYTNILAPANKNPEGLIWDQIKDEFFVKIDNDRYDFYRAPYELRYLAVDQSESKDVTGISMVHQEMSLDGKRIIVVDFTLAIPPTKERINLEAIVEFIFDLSRKGRILFGGIYFDNFESSTAIQKFKRNNYPIEKFSVDRTTEPYLTLVSYMKNGRIKSGRNIFLKNNFKSLREEMRKSGRGTKIDHTTGSIEYFGNSEWKTSTLGINAKDISDSLCSCFYNCIHRYKEVPRYQYEPLSDVYDQEKAKKEAIKRRTLEEVYENYGYETAN